MTAEDEDQGPPGGDGGIDGTSVSRNVLDRLADVTEASSMPNVSAVDADQPSGITDGVSLIAFYEALESEGRPVVVAQRVARHPGVSQTDAMDGLDALTGAGRIQRVNVEADPVVWHPARWDGLTSRERVVLFPEHHEIVVNNPAQYTRARLSQFAHLADTTGDCEDRDRGYLYHVRQEDVWQTPFDDVDSLPSVSRSVPPERSPRLEAWVEDQWKRTHQFRLYSHEEGYTVLETATESLVGNVAFQKLDDDHVYASISDTKAQAGDEEIVTTKRILYDAGCPVENDRDLEEDRELDVTFGVDLRDYQRDWVDRFVNQRAGALVGSPGVGKTVAGIGTLTAVGGEALILVLSRELARQWREELRSTTNLDTDQTGKCHGDAKEIRPIAIATYRTTGVDHHHSLPDSRCWGLIIHDEAHYIPSHVFQRSINLQFKRRFGLSATPTYEGDKGVGIFAPTGPSISTDRGRLFDVGYVQESEAEICYVNRGDDMAGSEWVSSDGRKQHILAAMNPGKIFEIRRPCARHANSRTLVLVDHLDQGEMTARALDVPPVSDEICHYRREAYLEALRDGNLDTLVISHIGDEGIDLPNAELTIAVSGPGDSCQQGFQRAGRTMRPMGSALVYVLTARGTSEGDFAQHQMQHFAGKDIRVREMSADDLDSESDGGDTDVDTDAEDDEPSGTESASTGDVESTTTDE